MFSEITREDVFRLETRRLWLRWPSVADAADWAVGLSEPKPEHSRGDPYWPQADSPQAASPQGARCMGPQEKAALERIASWRGDNATGLALHLVLTGHGIDRQPFGVVTLAPIASRHGNCSLVLRTALAPERRGRGYMTEAVQAVLDSAFMLSDVTIVAASARVIDPAFRRVLEKCGFSYCGTGLDAAPDGQGMVASDRFRLDRKIWTSLKLWRVPSLVRQRDREPAACTA